MSAALVDQFRGDFAPGDFTDEYQQELGTLIEEKLKKGDSMDTAATLGGDSEPAGNGGANGGNVVDLMEALKCSVELKRTRQADPSLPADAKAGKKSVANKSAAENGSNKASKKTAAKKPAATKKTRTKGGSPHQAARKEA